ncbi:MAG: phage head morphogenesis protein [Actinomycetota bacterium]|nr:phage head morphogenesis protein [Actinomycetota bacterium]
MATEADITRAVNRVRRALLRQDVRVRHEVAAAYTVAQRAITSELLSLTERIIAASTAGEEVNPAWLYRQTRYRILLDQADAAFQRLTIDAGRTIIAAQRIAVVNAQTDAAQLTLAAMGGVPPAGITVSFAHLPQGALLEMVGTLSPGSPLRTLLDDLGPLVKNTIARGLLEGIALGRSPREVARLIRGELNGVPRGRLLTISRTELLRSYREAQRRAWRANERLVRGWVWHAALDGRCCASCFALHGSEHDLDVPFGSHPGCRCSAVPALFARYGPSPAIRSGEEVFADQSAEVQRATLGPAKYALYAAGEIELGDVVQVRRSASWGTTRSVGGVQAALDKAEARRQRAA